MQRRAAWVILAIALVFAAIGFNVQASERRALAGTDVQGTITTNTIWNLSGSPYNLIGNIEIALLTTLTIEPGVVVNGDNHSILATGNLMVTGNAASRVVMNKVAVFPHRNQPSNPPCKVQIVFAEVHQSRISPFPSDAPCAFVLRDSQWFDIPGMEPIWLAALSEDAYIERNIFSRSTGIIVSASNFTTYIRNNAFWKPGSFYTQIFAVKSDGTPANRVIVELNSFLSSDSRALALGEGLNTNSGMTAINNYWGGVGTSQIESMIYDRNDNSNITNVIDYLPVLSSPHPDTPVFELPATDTPTPTGTPTQTGTPTPTATSTATNTPTASATSTPTPTPTPTPLACPSGGVNILQNSVQETTSQRLRVVFLLCNGTAGAIRAPRLAIRAYNAADEEIEYLQDEMQPGNFASGAQWCDIATFNTRPPNYVYLKFDKPTYVVAGHTQAPLSILDVNFRPMAPDITGRIRNDHPAKASSIYGRVSLFDKTGHVQTCAELALNNTDLGPNQATTFQGNYFDFGVVITPSNEGYAGYHIWADADTLEALPAYMPLLTR